MYGKKRPKQLIWSVIFSLFICISCTEESNLKSNFHKNVVICGETQGTTYNIIISEAHSTVNKESLDSIFLHFDNVLSTYNNSSVISILNKSIDPIIVDDNSGYFRECFSKSQLIFNQTNGYFDPSVFPLVKGWGFMNGIPSPLTQYEVDSILLYVDFTVGNLYDITFKNSNIYFQKNNPNYMMDFNSIAQGFSVDIIDRFLSSKGYLNYYIEVGGEIIVRGKNREGFNWRIGIDVPKENLEERSIENILHISDKAIATSGNYRNFYIKNGEKYVHSLNPKTGFPVNNTLLSVTVVAESCSLADGYATAFMVMGREETIDFIRKNSNLNIDVYMLYEDEAGNIKRSMSDGFLKYILYKN